MILELGHMPLASTVDLVLYALVVVEGGDVPLLVTIDEHPGSSESPKSCIRSRLLRSGCLGDLASRWSP